MLAQLKEDLRLVSSKKKAAILQRFFKTGPGQYGENDIFIGVTIPQLRAAAKKHYPEVTLKETESLLSAPIHEHRMAALLLLITKHEKSKSPQEKAQIIEVYLNNFQHINNWDLVDLSAPKILGPHFENIDRRPLYSFARSPHLWTQRIAILSTFHFIKNRDFTDALAISEILLQHPHDLIHKAVGWMLREIGKRDYQTEYNFLLPRYKKMPRTMLRYAIEKFPEPIRQKFLHGEIV